jgi:hypothetical protein
MRLLINPSSSATDGAAAIFDISVTNSNLARTLNPPALATSPADPSPASPGSTVASFRGSSLLDVDRVHEIGNPLTPASLGDVPQARRLRRNAWN